jgi:hypothetical protein
MNYRGDEIKDIETRTWPAPASMIGEIFGLHCSRKFDKALYQLMSARYPELPSIHGLPVGRLLGTVRLESLKEYPDAKSFYADTSRHLCDEKYIAPVRYGFVLKVIEKYEHPPPLKGALGFFEYPGAKGEWE